MRLRWPRTVIRGLQRALTTGAAVRNALHTQRGERVPMSRNALRLRASPIQKGAPAVEVDGGLSGRRALE